MKIKLGANFSFSKLLNYINSSEFGDFVSNTSVNPIIKASKEKIINGKVKPLLKRATIRARKQRNSKAVNTPLYDTGALYKSLQLSDVRTDSGVLKGTKGIMMEKYGLYHLQGFRGRSGRRVPKRNFIKFKSSDKISNKLIMKFREKFRRSLQR
jgi:hypothetical protein